MPHGKSPTHARKARPKKPAAKSRPSSKAAARPASDEASPRVRKTDESKRSDRSSGIGSAVRLQKLLAAAGFGSRRETERFLIDDRVTVNGRIAKLGDSADPRLDEIRVDGERLAQERPAYWLLHKPRGIVTTVRDEAGRRTVLHFIPESAGRVFPVGRLDKETSGLLLLTNDGDTAHALLHPSLRNEREYKVNVKGLIDDKAITQLERGIVLEEGRTAPGRVEQVRHDPDAQTSSFRLTLVEGRKRQIRRSLLLLGFPVRRLVRIRMGPLRLGRLAVGEARPLRSEERRELLDHVGRLRRGEAIPAASRPSKPAPSQPRASKPRPSKSLSAKPRAAKPGASKSRSQRAARSRKGTSR